MDNIDVSIPASSSTVADAEAACELSTDASRHVGKAEPEFPSSQLKEYRDQVAILKALPMTAAVEHVAETTACIEVEEPTD